MVRDLQDELVTMESWNVIEEFIKLALQAEDVNSNRM